MNFEIPDKYKCLVKSDRSLKSNVSKKFQDYIVSLYSNKFNFKDAWFLFKHYKDHAPLCKICGKEFVGQGKTCSKECGRISMSISKNNYSTEKRKEINDKRIKTNLSKYGCKCSLQNDIVRIKTEKTLQEKFECDTNISKSEYWRNKIKETSLKRYGVTNPTKSKIVQEKMKQTCIERYNVENVFCSYQINNELSLKRLSINNSLNSEECLNKSFQTKKLHKTFNSSSTENKAFNYVLTKFPNAIHSYKESRYPFNCDIYIPEIDTFIECNFHWTHGGKPYKCDCKECEEKLNYWKTKNSKYYDIAIHTWTIRDVNKRKYAIENNINFKEFWKLQELYDFIDNYEN